MVLIFWSSLRPPAQPTWPESQSQRFSPRQRQEARGRGASQAEPLTSAQGSCLRVPLPLALASPGLGQSPLSELRQDTCQGH